MKIIKSMDMEFAPPPFMSERELGEMANLQVGVENQEEIEMS